MIYTIELRILHLSDDRLPDWRIEKSAISASNLGYEVIFAGRNSETYHTDTFSRKYEINWTERSRRGIPFYWHSVKKQVERTIRESKPDIVHAHNIFSAKMISEFRLPFIYDDHEHWSEFSKILMHADAKMSRNHTSGLPRKALRRVARNLLNRRAMRLWTKWEKEVVSSVPTITVSDKIAEDLRAIGNSDKIFIVPNFPTKFETEKFEKPKIHPRLSSIYAGSDGLNKQKIPNRNIDGITEIFANKNIGGLTIIGWEGKSSSDKIMYSGLLSRQSMFLEMLKHSIGLIPFKKHWSHVFVSPNKAYEYAHAGLLVMCTTSLKPIKQTLEDNCMMFEDYNDLVSQLEYFRDNLDELYKKRLKTFEFARNNLTWERYENNIFRAYQLC